MMRLAKQLFSSLIFQAPLTQSQGRRQHSKMSQSRFSELLIATSNPGKIRELESLLAALPLRLRSLKEFPSIQEVAETGDTFTENATLKATGYARQTRLWTLADDSGLEVEALGGAPGVFSARYGGPDASDADRVKLLLDTLSRANDPQRRARFTAVVVIAAPDAQVMNVAQGLCAGHLTHAPRGTNGFGYDPIFIPDGFQQTFGELSDAAKHSISHRARALEATRAFLSQRLPA
jgi:XTP/dITP diphosphohydrolase